MGVKPSQAFAFIHGERAAAPPLFPQSDYFAFTSLLSEHAIEDMNVPVSVANTTSRSI
jgi:hypothetical protein